MLSIMLDPQFGKGAITRSEVSLAMARLKDHLIKNSSRPKVAPKNVGKNRKKLDDKECYDFGLNIENF